MNKVIGSVLIAVAALMLGLSARLGLPIVWGWMQATGLAISESTQRGMATFTLYLETNPGTASVASLLAGGVFLAIGWMIFRDGQKLPETKDYQPNKVEVELTAERH